MTPDQDPRDRRRHAVTRTSVVGAIVNLILSIIKIVVGTLGHSQVLVADGFHSLSDLLSDGLVLAAGRRASEAPDRDHPYGHARYETVATLVLGLLLIFVGAGIAWDAIHRLFDPSDLLRPEPLALLAAVASILVKEWLYWWTLGYEKRVKSDLLRANAWHHRTDAVSSVVVLIGIAGTMAGLAYLDAIAAVLVAIMIARIGWGLGREAITELVDTGLESDRLAAVTQTISPLRSARESARTQTICVGDSPAH